MLTDKDLQDYSLWVEHLKKDLHQLQVKAAMQVNRSLLAFYWKLGKEMIVMQEQSQWGDGFLFQLSRDLTHAFPGTKGFSKTNLFYIRKWVHFYQNIDFQTDTVNNSSNSGLPQFVPQLVEQIPWGHNREIISKCQTVEEAVFYVRETIKHNWSRAVLSHQIATRLFDRRGGAIDNFEATLPVPQAELARETLKNPYNFEFLTLSESYRERELETALIERIQQFLLELGQGFAFVGRQYPLKAGISDFYLDLLFYHIKLKAYVVIELKTTDFQPEFAGKLNFYLNVVDDKLRDENDNPSIGLLLCKTPDKVVVEYSLKNMNTPLGVSEYLPSIQAIQETMRG